MKSSIWQHKAVSFILLALFVLFLSMAQFKTVLGSFDKNLLMHIHASQGVVDGLPHWRIYQSRVLGPYMVEGLKQLSGWSTQDAYLRMMLAWFVLMSACLVAVAVSIWRSKLIAVGVASAAAFLNVTVMQGTWLYPWDYLDFIVFTLLIWAIIKNKPLRYIIAIIIVEMFNREAAVLVAGWLALDALLQLILKRNGATEETIKSAKVQLAVGVALAVLGLAIVEALRTTLLVKEMGPEILTQGDKDAGSMFAFKLMKNISYFGTTFFTTNVYYQAYNILIISIPVICILGMRTAIRELQRVSTLYLVLWVFTIIFAMMYETRVWVAFVPFLSIAAPWIFLQYSNAQTAMEMKR